MSDLDQYAYCRLRVRTIITTVGQSTAMEISFIIVRAPPSASRAALFETCSASAQHAAEPPQPQQQGLTSSSDSAIQDDLVGS